VPIAGQLEVWHVSQQPCSKGRPYCGGSARPQAVPAHAAYAVMLRHGSNEHRHHQGLLLVPDLCKAWCKCLKSFFCRWVNLTGQLLNVACCGQVLRTLLLPRPQRSLGYKLRCGGKSCCSPSAVQVCRTVCACHLGVVSNDDRGPSAGGMTMVHRAASLCLQVLGSLKTAK